MKHFLIVSFLIIFNLPLYSQIDFGFKIGVNFDSMGDLSDTENFINQSNLQSKTGYHIGIYSDFIIPFFNLRQELDYSKNISYLNQIKVEIYKFQLPILVGYNIIKPINLIVGPSFQYLIKKKSENIILDSFKEKYTTSFIFGLEFNIKRIIISAKYERGFTDNEILIIDSQGNSGPGHIHIRPKQYILSILYSLASNKK
tara:strand:- start:24215 stop:24814 length:600 start_codon:yes stop_codon:yes gene_type:complete